MIVIINIGPFRDTTLRQGASPSGTSDKKTNKQTTLPVNAGNLREPSPAPTSVLWKLRFGEAWGPGAALWPTSGLSLLTPGSSLPSHWPSSHPALAASPVPLMGPRWSAPASLLALGGRDQGSCLGSGARRAGCYSSHPSPTFQSAGTAERGPGGSLAANQGENRAWGFRVSKAVLNLGSTYAL